MVGPRPEGVIHPQGLADLNEQPRIVGQFIDKIPNLFLERHGARLAPIRISPQPRISLVQCSMSLIAPKGADIQFYGLYGFTISPSVTANWR
jgi:hypothetical protein